MIGRLRVVGAGDALPDVLGALGQAEHRAARGLQHLAGAADQLAGDQERDQHVGQPAELAVPADQVVLVAAVRVAGRVGVVLEQVDLARDALVVQPLLGVDQQALEDPLAGPVVGDQVGDRVAFGGRVLGVGADVEVEAGTVAQEDVAGASPGHHPAEQVARHLVRRQPPLPPVGARDAVLGLEAEDSPFHDETLAVARAVERQSQPALSPTATRTASSRSTPRIHCRLDEPSGHRRRRLHRLALRPDRARRRAARSRGRRVTVLDKLTYAGNFANLGPVAEDKRLDFVPGDVCDAPLVDTTVPRPRRDRALRGGVARRPVDPAAAEFATTNVVGTQVLLDAALRHGTAAFVHVSTDEVYGSIDTGAWTERAPLRAELAVRGHEGRRGPAGAGLPPHPRAAGGGDPERQQLRAVPAPGEADPPVRDEPAGRPHGAALRRRRPGARLGARGRPLPRRSAGAGRRAGPARSTTSAAAPS